MMNRRRLLKGIVATAAGLLGIKFSTVEAEPVRHGVSIKNLLVEGADNRSIVELEETLSYEDLQYYFASLIGKPIRYTDDEGRRHHVLVSDVGYSPYVLSPE